MILFHGTSVDVLPDLLEEGVLAPSYWGTYQQALERSLGFGKQGIVIRAHIDRNDLSASMLMVNALYESGDIEDYPDEDDLEFSLEWLGGVTCYDVITEFEVLR
jgi:hypothetical protein